MEKLKLRLAGLAHTYVEAVAQAIYGKLPTYWKLLQAVHGRIMQRLTADYR